MLSKSRAIWFGLNICKRSFDTHSTQIKDVNNPILKAVFQA